MSENKKRLLLSIWVCFLVVSSNPLIVFAQSPQSDNYKIEEYYFGTGGEVDASSDNYRARQSTGALGVGNGSSDNYDASAGFTTQSEPFLEMVVMNATVNLSPLDSGSTSSGAAQAGACNCSFYVKSYLSSEYVVITASQPPTSENGDSLDAKATTGAPSGSDTVEEFGINVVNNSSPNVGADPLNQPDNTFADGEAFGDGVGGSRDYDDVDQFAYGVGDIIARSQATAGNPAIGLTEYTISYIAKPSLTTPAGYYQMRHDLIAVPTF